MLYNIIMYVYQTGIAIYSHFNEKVKKMWTGERAAFGVLQKQVEPNAEYIWFHAASLGEFEQGRPLIERIKKEYPHYKILLTFFSPSGYEVRKNYEQADIVTYLPIDTVANARKFLRAVRPVMAFFIKYEFWYNYLHILRHRNVPVYSVSSIFRPNQIFFRPYGRQYAAVLKCFSHFFVQNDLSKKLLAKIGINDVTVVGDTRFDRVLQIKESSKCLPLLDKFIGNKEVKSAAGHSKALRQVFVAGSSWLPDEEIFIKYFDKHSEWKLIIAPHVIANSHLQQILQLLKGKKVVFYTKATEENVADADVLIVDCFGLLSSIYHYCDVAYVGGGFGVGIHNVLEAAVWSVPVMFGPNNKRFAEAQGLLASKGGFEVDNYEMFAQVMEKFSSDKAFLQRSGNAAGDFVKRLSGATDKVFSSIKL
ncbi:3-deoxy-D-manno-octulosonic acid transferase [Prevotella nigrescens]